jgi:hypothetical protein
VIIYDSGGGFWGVSAAASAGFAAKNETQSVTAKSEERKEMNIVYKVILRGKKSLKETGEPQTLTINSFHVSACTLIRALLR